MRREEAEQEAAWRNGHDERRSRLEFYAFDASAGLADSAWEVTVRLRRGPPPADGVATEAAPDTEAWDPSSPAPWERDEYLAELAELEPAHAPAPRRAPGRRRRGHGARRGREGRRTRPRSRRDRRAAEKAERPPRPSRSRLEWVSRFVGALVIAVAVVWLGLITALAVLVGATSPTGVAVYVGALLAGLVAVGFGVLVRRA